MLTRLWMLTVGKALKGSDLIRSCSPSFEAMNRYDNIVSGKIGVCPGTGPWWKARTQLLDELEKHIDPNEVIADE